MIRQRLLELQWRQFNHDELYHREIARLIVSDRMKHMTLHLAKYAGQIADMSADGRTDGVTRPLVDAYIICLSAANTLSLDFGRDLSDGLEEADTVADLGGRMLGKSAGSLAHEHGFAHNLSIAVGRLAKACESLDHVEAFAFREKMQAALVQIFDLVVTEAARRGLDLEKLTQDRQDGVRSRHMFDEFLRPILAAATDRT